jgi:class 3 adenylate cyclase/pimeloyl-ACP methyl ester carboxylesterase
MSADRDVRYADSGGLQIAYEVLGDGPLDIVFSYDTGGNIDLMHDLPEGERFLRRFSEFGRLIHMDPRGAGLSDPVEDLPTLEDLVDDVSAVLAAVGSERAAFVGNGNAAQLFMLFAAMHPNQTAALVTINGYARLRRADDYPWGQPPGYEAASLQLIADGWGTGFCLGPTTPSMMTDPRRREWIARVERASATPRHAAVRQRLALDLDVRDVLSTIDAPTLVIASRDNDYVRPGHGQYLVNHIVGAHYVELPTADHVPFLEGVDELMDLIQEFLTGSTRRAHTDRALKTVAFTDIVESTQRAAELGDRRWHDLLETHESIARHEVEVARGQLIKFTGDGLMATFDGPARAVQCMQALGDALGPHGLPIRAGVHTGEVELIGDDIGGIAVHIAARISALAGAGEVFTSSTVRDLTAGSGLVFEDRGEQQLKGVAEPWRIFEVAR